MTSRQCWTFAGSDQELRRCAGFHGRRVSCGKPAKNQGCVCGGAARQPIIYEPHVAFKQRVPQAIGLIRTGDTTQYANLTLESG